MGKFLKKYRVVLILLLVIAVGVSGFLYNKNKNAGTESVYQTSKSARGTLTATIGATGTVRAKQTDCVDLAGGWYSGYGQCKGRG